MTSQQPAQNNDVDSLSRRLRLKRLFLIALVASLATCTAVAVGVLLFGQFGRITLRILGTLGAVAFHSAVAMICAHTLERRRWPALSVAGLILFGLNFAVLVTCIWAARHDDPIARAIVTTVVLLGFYVLAIPCASLRERRRWVPAAWAGLVACAGAFLLTLVCIWWDDGPDDVYVKAAVIAAIVAFSFAHTCLLGRIPGGLGLDWLLRAALYCLWTVAALASMMIAFEIKEEGAIRILGALGVLDASSSLALVIMTTLRRMRKIEKLETTEGRIEIRCPRCTTRQVVDAGASKCTACGLKFRIEIEEPRCAKCDYLLWNLPERRCPECGTPF
jgi:hypothetical protein